MIAPGEQTSPALAGNSPNKIIYFRQIAAVALVWLMVLPPAPLFAGTKKGDKLRNQARIEEVKGNLQKAFDLTSQAVAEDPGDPSYNLQLHRIRFELGVQHVKNGQNLRNAGKIAEALSEFEKGYAIDPSSDVAAQEIKRTHEIMDREKNKDDKPADKTSDKPGGQAEKKEDTSGMTPAAVARKEQEARTDALNPIPILRPLNSDLIDLKMTTRARTLWETAAKVAGINVVFDPDYNSQQTMTQPIMVDLSHTTIEAALDQLSLITKSFWKPINANTIFVSIDSRNNRTAFTEQVVKVFYLSNPTTPQEIQEILTVLRTVVDVQKVFNYTAQNALVVRCDADVMALVEKLIADLDKPHAEVIVDVMVMQVSSTYIRNLGAGLANGINASGTFTPRASITTPTSTSATSTSTTSTTTTATTTTPTTGTTGTSTGSSIPFSQVGHISSADFSLSGLPGAQFEAMLTDSSTRVLQAPQIRIANNMKGTINIGDKIPIATGSFQSAVGAVGALPAANTQFSFQDVGVNVEITPIIHDNDEITMNVTLDVSAVKDRIDVGGVSQPEITQNKLTSQVRLRDGEVNLIGGLITDSDSKALTGLPGLAHIPLIGRLFSNEDYEKDKEELVIALVPHIVRGVDISASNLKGVAMGSSQQIKVTYDTSKLPSGAAPGNAAQPPQAVNQAPVTTVPVSLAPGAPAAQPAPPQPGPPATAPPLGSVPLGVPGVGAPLMGAPGGRGSTPRPGANATPPPGGAESGAIARVSIQPSSTTVKVKDSVTMTIYAENVVNLADVSAQLQYDPKILRLTNIVGGDLPGRNLAPLELSKTVLDDVGRADMRTTRGSNGGTISGSGALFIVTFQAMVAGNASVALSSLTIGSPAGPVPAGTSAPASVTVQ
jgi:general secretion pathway protein D